MARGAIRIEGRDGELVAQWLEGNRATRLDDFYAWGAGIYFILDRAEERVYEGVVEGNRIVGTLNGTQSWIAQRTP